MKNIQFIACLAVLFYACSAVNLRYESSNSVQSGVKMVTAEIAEPIHYENQYHSGENISPEIVYSKVEFRFKETEKKSEISLGKMAPGVHYSTVDTVQVEPQSEGGYFSPEIVGEPRFVEVEKVSKLIKEERKKKHHKKKADGESTESAEALVKSTESKQEEPESSEAKQDTEQVSEAKSKQDDVEAAGAKAKQEETEASEAKAKQEETEAAEAKAKQEETEETGAKVKQEETEETGAKVKQEETEETGAKQEESDAPEAKSARQDEPESTDLQAKVRSLNKLDIVHPPEYADKEFEPVLKVAHISDYSKEDLARIAAGGARPYPKVKGDDSYNISPEIYHHVIQSATTDITTAHSPLTEVKKVLWRDFEPPSPWFKDVHFKNNAGGQQLPEKMKDELGHDRDYWSNVLNYPTPVDVGEVLERPSSGLGDLTDVANPIASRSFNSVYNHSEVPNPVDA